MHPGGRHTARIGLFFLLAALALGAALLWPSKTAVAPSGISDDTAVPSNVPAREDVVTAIITADEIPSDTELTPYYPVAVSQDSTAYDAMRKAERTFPFRFSGKDFGEELGFFVESVNGVPNDTVNRRYWTLYVNGVTATVGVSNYIVKEGDHIEWRFEDISEESP